MNQDINIIEENNHNDDKLNNIENKIDIINPFRTKTMVN